MAALTEPILKVGTKNIPTDIPTPSSLTYNLADISASDSGRTQDGKMHKNRIGQAVTMAISWNAIDSQTAHKILTAFQAEYINIKYYDLIAGDYVTRTFYVGDRSVPMYNAALNLWQNVSFNVIQRSLS